jgi:Ca2+-binding RTX toxin-like protein
MPSGAREGGTMKRRWVAFLASLFIAVAPSLSLPASATTSCSWNAIDHILSVSIGDDEVGTLVVSGTSILLNGSPCDPSATTATVDNIEVGGGTFGVLILRLDGGPFAPGAEVEATGTSEIEITTDLVFLHIGGTPVEDTFSFGASGANLNADDDVDVSFADDGYISVVGRGGNDSITAAGDSVVGSGLVGTELELDGGAGNDSLTGGSRFDQLFGGPDADSLVGGAGGDELLGEGGNDFLVGGPGSDGLRGGRDRDQISYAASTGGVVVDLKSRTARADSRIDEVKSIEDVIGSSFADVLIGNEFPNELRGRGGGDLLNGRGGWDHLFGEGGRDKVSFDGSPFPVVVNLGSGAASGWGHDSITEVEVAIGSGKGDTLIGNGGSNLLRGRGGDDKISGAGGPDSLIGGSGQDGLNGGIGRDLLHGGAGNDSLNGGPGTDTCYQDSGTGPKTSCEEPLVGSASGGGVEAWRRWRLNIA